MQYFLTSCSSIKEKSADYNEAEWMVDVITEADRKGKGGMVADHWASSEHKKVGG